MLNRRKLKLIVILLFLVFAIIILSRLIAFTLSRYESTGQSDTEVDIAFYVLNPDYQSMTLNLDTLVPRNTPYTYSFTVSNSDGTNRAEVDLEYEIVIRTTTNLPISYRLYMNEVYTASGATSIFTSNETIQDDYNTYFKRMETDTVTLNYTETTTNTYQLVLDFPTTYNTYNYQDIIEAIEISVNSRQVI